MIASDSESGSASARDSEVSDRCKCNELVQGCRWPLAAANQWHSSNDGDARPPHAELAAKATQTGRELRTMYTWHPYMPPARRPHHNHARGRAHKTCTQEQVLLTSAALGRASTQRACVYADGVSTQTTLRGNPTRHRQAMVSEVATTWLQHTVRHFSSTTDAQLHSYTTQTQCAQGTPQ